MDMDRERRVSGWQPESHNDNQRADWRRKLAASALALAALASACSQEPPPAAPEPVPGTAVETPKNYAETDFDQELPDSDFAREIDPNLQYSPQDYPPDIEALGIPNSLEKCGARMQEIIQDASRHEDFLLRLAGNLQLTEEAWYHLRVGAKFYCNSFELSQFCLEGTGVNDSLFYAAGCFEAWVEGDYFYTVMHLPMDESLLPIMSHELLHATELYMTQEEWDAISDLLIEALIELDPRELTALAHAGELEAFISEVEEDDLGRITSLSLDFSSFQNQDYMSELYATAGTVFSHLPDELEEHYARYFVDRQAIVRLNWEHTRVKEHLELLFGEAGTAG